MLRVHVGLQSIAEFPDDELSDALIVLNNCVKSFCELCMTRAPTIRESCGISHVVVQGAGKKIVSVIYWETWQKINSIVNGFKNPDGKISELSALRLYEVHVDDRIYGYNDLPHVAVRY